MPDTLRGSCLCEAVAYEVEDTFAYALNCHCSKCCRTTGAAYKPLAGIETAKLRVTGGDDRTMIYGDPAGSHDIHCATCGSLLYSVVREGRYVHVSMGTLIDPPSIRPTQHIFVGSSARWHEITDDLPQKDVLAPWLGRPSPAAPALP